MQVASAGGRYGDRPKAIRRDGAVISVCAGRSWDSFLAYRSMPGLKTSGRNCGAKIEHVDNRQRDSRPYLHKTTMPQKKIGHALHNGSLASPVSGSGDGCMPAPWEPVDRASTVRYAFADRSPISQAVASKFRSSSKLVRLGSPDISCITTY